MSHAVFNGLSLDDIDESTLLMPASVAGAVGELVAAYRQALKDLELERTRVELVRRDRDQLAAEIRNLKSSARGGES